LRFLCTGVQADGSARRPHDYGVVIIALNIAESLVPAGQVEPLRQAIRRFLWASHVDIEDHNKAQTIFAQAQALEIALPEPARNIMHEINTRDVGALGPLLLPKLAGFGDNPALSPEKSPPPACPVYLLHGAGDNVIPAVESSFLAQHYRDQATVHLLITPLITHAEMDQRGSALDVWRLVRFWQLLFRE
jgi:pimeloyl-ACP methyl ester carboxylesterase